MVESDPEEGSGAEMSRDSLGPAGHEATVSVSFELAVDARKIDSFSYVATTLALSPSLPFFCSGPRA